VGIDFFNVEGALHRLTEGGIEVLMGDHWERADGELPAIMQSGKRISRDQAADLANEYIGAYEGILDAPPATKRFGQETSD
jgi:hypothetical protein